MAKVIVDTNKATPLLSLPELILHAVTESASIRTLHDDGRVIWSADALHRLSAALQIHFREVSGYEPFVHTIRNMIETGLQAGMPADAIITAFIRVILEVGTGLTVERK